MSTPDKIKEHTGAGPEPAVESLMDKFKYFLALLENNNMVLRMEGELEQKFHEGYTLEDIYLNQYFNEISEGVRKIVDNMISLGGEEYRELLYVFDNIKEEIASIIGEKQEIHKDTYIKWYKDININYIHSVGSKNARLGELKSILRLPIPDGFAITAWAYKYFLDITGLQEKISALLSSINYRKYTELEKVSSEIKRLISGTTVPEDLAEAIISAYDTMMNDKPGGLVAVRSSALGEDTNLSFAGQYATFLCVGRNELIKRYKDVIASKFTPKAIYYYYSHGLDESALAMSVGCTVMIDSEISGVIYTKDPVDPQEFEIVINSVYGLGKYLVDGIISPDMYIFDTLKNELIESKIVEKNIMLRIGARSSLAEYEVDKNRKNVPSLTDDIIKRLAEYATGIEKYFAEPQDIEWAVDRKGALYILQSRPLKVIEDYSEHKLPDTGKYKLLFSGGISVYPGGGGGKIFPVRSEIDLKSIPEGAVIAAEYPVPGLITALNRANALITRTGGIASHLATIAREYRVPALFGVEGFDLPEPGTEITVHSRNKKIYAGYHKNLIESLRIEQNYIESSPSKMIFSNVLRKISPLNLLHSSDSNFRIRNCRTYHDITRYAHQKALEEMFRGVDDIKGSPDFGFILESSIPLEVNIIYIDRDLSVYKDKKYITPGELDNEPFGAFWKGLETEGWPAKISAKTDGFRSLAPADPERKRKKEFGEFSYAILGKDFMILSLKLGYHFTTFETMCTENESSNYIKMQLKSGGAAMERRIRRISLMSEILNEIGFYNNSKGDFLDTFISYQQKSSILDKLYMLGRMTMMTKQLDMALSNDRILQFYVNDIKHRLGIT